MPLVIYKLILIVGELLEVVQWRLDSNSLEAV